jgi:MFS family permease
MAPPYLFSAVGVGLMQIPAIIAFVIATFLGGYLADTITACMIRKQNDHVAPAQRLVGLLPAFWVAPAGCIITAIACSQRLHWIAIAFGFGMGKTTTQTGNVYRIS